MWINLDENKGVGKNLRSKKTMTRIYGSANANLLIKRFDLLSRAATLADLLHKNAGKIHLLERDRKGQFAMHLADGKRLIFEPMPPIPFLPDGGIDLHRVTEVRIMEITDYH